MSYTIRFSGKVSIAPPLNPAETEYLTLFSERRRMERAYGPYFVSDFGRGRDADIIEYNRPLDGQPSLWCQWVPTPDGTALVWDQGKEFYNAPEWMQYLIDHFLKPDGAAKGCPGFGSFSFDHTLDGLIRAQGDDPHDTWQLAVIRNTVHAVPADTEILTQIDEVLRDASVGADAMRSRPLDPRP